MRSARLGSAVRRSRLLAPLLLAAAASCAGAAKPSPNAAPSPEPPPAGSPSLAPSPSESASSVASAPVASARASAPAAPPPVVPSDAARCADASIDAASRLSACEAACATRDGALRWMPKSAEACLSAGDLATGAGGGARATLRAAHDFDLACRATASVPTTVPTTAPTTAPAGCAKRDALLERLRATCGAKDLASCVAHGRGVATMHAPTPAARAQANASLALACNAKSAEACEVRGDLLADRDAPAALASYQQGCDFGRGHACCEQAAMLLLGSGTQADEPSALAIRDRARRFGDAGCMEEYPIGGPDPINRPKLARTLPLRTVDTERYLPTTAPKVTSRTVSGSPGLDESLERSLPRLRQCVEREFVVNGAYHAVLTIGGSIDVAGKLTAARLEGGGGASTSLGECVRVALLTTSFPSGKAIAYVRVEVRVDRGD